jgi:tellurite resistance protein
MYFMKIVRYFDAVKHEWNHPVRHAFFPAFSIALLILSVGYLDWQPGVSFWLWVVGATLQLILTIHVLSTWMFHDRFEITMINPAWFIPVVGNVLVPIAGAHHAPLYVGWFFLSYGMFFWVLLQTIVLYRVIFHSPLPEKLLPTLFIMIAPPAVSFLSYLALEHTLNGFAYFLFGVALFITLLLFYQAPRFIRLPFALPWWAYSFPLAAMTIACFKMAHISQVIGFAYLGWGMLVILSLVVVVLVYKTVNAMVHYKVCVPE